MIWSAGGLRKGSPQSTKGRAWKAIACPFLPLFADHLDGLKLLDGLVGDANLWED